MSAIGRALAYLGLAAGFAGAEIYNLADLGKIARGNSAPQASRNSHTTHGKRHASQKARANRRKAGMKARVRR